MKKIPFFLGMILLLGACQTPTSSREKKASSESITPAVKTAFDKQLELQGSELLYAYYCLGNEADIAAISQKLGYTMMGDILYMLRHDFNPEEYATLKSEIAAQVDAMSEEERKARSQEAALFLKVMHTINGETCGIDGETYSEILYEIPETQAIIDKYIDPQMGQSTSSLASGQAQEIDVESWVFITRAEKSLRLRIMSDFLEKCSRLSEL
ncbi:MAG: hypothetical protein R8P61_24705 [Bacteroidia bacterium]|nr:hypothetical protein [Bacteroidia bacterium]